MALLLGITIESDQRDLETLKYYEPLDVWAVDARDILRPFSVVHKKYRGGIRNEGEEIINKDLLKPYPHIDLNYMINTILLGEIEYHLTQGILPMFDPDPLRPRKQDIGFDPWLRPLIQWRPGYK